MEKDAGFAALEAIAILVAILGFGPKILGWLLGWLAAQAATGATKYFDDHPSAFQAATSGNVPLLAELLASGIDIDGRDTYGRTLLHCATMARHLDVVDLLLREGARTDITVTSASEEATALGIATGLRWREGVELLLRYDAQMEPEAELLLGGSTFIRSFLNGGGDPDHLFSGTPLICMAARDGNIGLIRLLLDAGADVNACDSKLLGWTPLLWTAQGLFLSEQRQMELAELFVHRGADIEQPDNCRLRPLHVAAESGAAGVVRLLLDNGADIEANSNAGSPLHAAASKGHAECISILLDRGAICDRRNGVGKTALHLAVNRGHLEAVRVLLQRGANIHLKAHFLVSTIEYAPDEAMANLLKSYGSN